MTEFDGPDTKSVRRVLGNINADNYEKIKTDAKKAHEAPAATKGRGNKQKGSTRDARLKVALDLVARCHNAFVPPPKSLVLFLTDTIGAKLNIGPPEHSEHSLSKKQWDAIDRLIRLPSFHLNWSDGDIPIKFSTRQFAEKIGVTHPTIKAWWAKPEFRRGIILRLSMILQKDIDDVSIEAAGPFTYIPPAGDKACLKCQGTGYLQTSATQDNLGKQSAFPCSECNGSGYLPGKPNS
jgi:hypothetical protein